MTVAALIGAATCLPGPLWIAVLAISMSADAVAESQEPPAMIEKTSRLADR